MRKTKTKYENYLNDFYLGQDVTYLPQVNPSKGLSLLRQGKLGTWMRKHDPIQFEVGFDEWNMR